MRVTVARIGDDLMRRWVWIVRCEPDERNHEGFLTDGKWYEDVESAEKAQAIADRDVGVCGPHSIETLTKG